MSAPGPGSDGAGHGVIFGSGAGLVNEAWMEAEGFEGCAMP